MSAERLSAEITPLTQADLAEAFERGRAAERAFMERLAAYHHWSSISAGPPDPPTNPYRTSPRRSDA